MKNLTTGTNCQFCNKQMIDKEMFCRHCGKMQTKKNTSWKNDVEKLQQDRAKSDSSTLDSKISEKVNTDKKTDLKIGNKKKICIHCGKILNIPFLL